MNKFMNIYWFILVSVLLLTAACGGETVSFPRYDYQIIIGDAVRDGEGIGKNSHRTVDILIPGKNDDLVRFRFNTRVTRRNHTNEENLDSFSDIKKRLKLTRLETLSELTDNPGNGDVTPRMVSKFVNSFRFVEDTGACKVMKRYHLVMSGESLVKIAEKSTNVSHEEIRLANNIRRSDVKKLKIGRLLVIPRNEEYKIKTICIDNDLLKKHLPPGASVVEIADIKKSFLAQWNTFKKRVRGSKHPEVAEKLIERAETHMGDCLNLDGKEFIYRTFGRINGSAVALRKLMQRGETLAEKEKTLSGRGGTVTTIFFFAFLALSLGLAVPEAVMFFKNKRKS